MIYNMLYDYQKKIIDSLYIKDSYGLFLDMGLGKTPIALAFAEKNKCTKVIVITINSKALETKEVKGSWLNWALKSNISYKLNSKKSLNFDIKNNDLLLINYESLFNKKESNKGLQLKDNVLNFIQSCKDHNVAIIVDESHKIKNLQSKQTKAIYKLKSMLTLKARKVYTYLLTGTPFTTGYVDLYAQLKILGCPILKDQFVDQFCIKGYLPGLLGWQQPIVGYKNLDKLYKLVHTYAITIKSEEIVKLPEKIFVNHITQTTDDFNFLTKDKISGVEINKRFQKYGIECDAKYDTKSKINNPFYRNIDYPEDEYLADTPGLLWLRARQLSIGFQGNAEKYKWYDQSRLKLLEQFLKDHEDNYLLFYNYTPEMLEIFEICEKLGYNIDIYCGEIKSLTFYNKFCKLSPEQKLTSSKNIILANFASGSTGMNWQEYNKCIIFSTPLYKDYEQGIKRIHRLGQKQTTFYHIFYQDNWLDNSMMKALQESIDYSKDMFDDDLKRVQSLHDHNDNP